MKVVLLAQAQEDLDQIVDPLLSRVVRHLRLLGDFPELGTAMVGPLAGYRSCVVAMFRIVYRIRTPAVVEVAYIRHCRRRPPA